MMSFGCCKHVLKVYVNLTDEKRNKKTLYTYTLKSLFSQQRPTGKLQTLYCITQDRKGNTKIWVFKIPPGGGSKSVSGSRPIIINHCKVIWFCCNSVPKFSLNFSFSLRCFMNMARAQKIKNEKILKLTVNTGQVMFSGEIYYY